MIKISPLLKILFVFSLNICLLTYGQEKPDTTFRIAVICHILHQGQPVGTSPNISTAQVNSQFVVLNQDFNRQNPDTTNTPAIFRDRAAAVGVEFTPAALDTNYQILAEPGIDRIQVSLAAYNRTQVDSIRRLHAWDPEKYLNIWIVTLDDNLVGGYANYPTGSTLTDLPTGTLSHSGLDGVVIQPLFFGSNHTAAGNIFNLKTPYEWGRTATHEVGHWLGLKHIWGDGDCSVDDGVDDTPTAGRANLGACDIIPNSCGAGDPGDLPDMVQNFMDYSWPTCKNLFTQGQRTRIHKVLKQAPRRKTLDEYFVSVTDTKLVRDSLALIELYNSTNGSNWKVKWNFNQPLNSWYGITITGGRVTALNLKSNNLTGIIPSRIRNLDSLASLNLEGNRITGLPDLSAMAKFTQLKVANNYLTLSDLKANLSKFSDSTNYSPQFSRTGKKYRLNRSQNLTLKGGIHRAGYTYQWFHQNNLMSGQVDSTLNLVNLQIEDSGLYNCRIEVNDAVLIDLVLVSQPDTLLVNLSPTDIQLSDYQFPENKPTGTFIGRLSTLTPDSDTLHTYTITGADRTKFTITADSLKSNFSFDYESEKLYNITITATDRGGLSVSKAFNISITNVNERPLSLTLSDSITPENGSTGTLVGRFNTRDIDTRDNHIYTLTGGNLAGFSIFGNRLETAKSLDYETDSIYIIEVTTQDLGGLTYSQNFTIKVTNVNEAPQAITLSNNTISENKPAGTLVGNLSTSDPDSSDSHVYKLTGFGAYAFSITGTTLKNKGPFDFENKSKYEVEITVTDRGGLTKTDTFTIQVANVIEHIEGSRLRDSLALVALYANTGGSNWTRDWDLDQPLETWHGVKITDTRVVELNLKANNLVGQIPNAFKDISHLKVLDLAQNKLVSLNDLSTMMSLDTFRVASNRLTFETLKPNLALFHDSAYYAPQAKIGSPQSYYLADSQSVTMTVSLPEPDNTYQWYHNDTLLTGQINATLKIKTVLFSIDNGSYYCKITNSTVPRLTLTSAVHEVVIGHEILESDSLALVALYDSAGGVDWKIKWNLSTPVHTWYGVKVVGPRVVRLELPDNNLKGLMPDQMANLTLELLNLNDNFLTRLVLPDTKHPYIKNNNFNFDDITKYFGPVYRPDGGIWFDNVRHCGGHWWEYGQVYPTRKYDWKNHHYYVPQRTLEHGKYYRVQRGSRFVLRAPKVGGANGFGWFDNYFRKRGIYRSMPGLNVSRCTNGHALLWDDGYCPDGRGSSSTSRADSLIIDPVEIKYDDIYTPYITNYQVYRYYSKRNDRCTGRPSYKSSGYGIPYDYDLNIHPITPDTLVVETVPPREYEILKELYKATKGEEWTTTWDTLQAVRNWHGIILTSDLNHVTGIRLPSNNLVGTVPASLSGLDSLRSLDLSGNKLSGFPNLTRLSSLDTLKVELNELRKPDILPNLGLFKGVTNYYSPQNLLGGRRYSTFVGDTVKLSVKVYDPNYIYKWVQNKATALNNSNSATFALNNIQVENRGLYHCEVSDIRVPGLILRSGFDTLIIQTVIESDSLALVAIYDSTAGRNWKNKWDLSQPANTWYGLTVRRGRVRSIKLNDNNLAGFIPSAVDTLEVSTFELDDNRLYGLNLPVFEPGAKIRLRRNDLDFADLVPHAVKLDSLKTYSPQNLVRAGKFYEQNFYDSIMLSVDVGGLNNQYQWFLDSVPLSGATTPKLKIPRIDRTHGGIYFCRITNLGLPALTLESGLDTLIISPREIDSLALVALYNQTQGSNWKNKWVLKQPLTTWDGVTMNGERVMKVDLPENNLKGRLPADLKDLTQLTKLHLQNNLLDSLDSLKLAVGLDFQVQNNRLTVLDINPNLSLFGNIAYYSPQTIRTGSFNEQTVGSVFEVKAEVSRPGSNYQWFLDGKPLAGKTAANFRIDSIGVLDIGIYHCEATHPTVPNLKRISLADTLSIAQRSLDSLALVALYKATDGLNWRTSWNLKQPIHTWYGVRMRDGTVSELRLFSNKLKGNLPLEIGYLKKLSILEISDNSLTGALPPTLGRLERLHTLNLFDNQFSDSLPPEIGNLQNLITLDIGDNKLSGNLPAELGGLKNLTTFYFMNNDFTGPIPSEIGELVHLVRVDGENNKLTGSIPPEIGKLIHLETLYLCNNKLSGPIPPEVGRLVNLQILYLCENDLADSIPTEIGKLINLVKLNLAGNKLEGALPGSIGNLKELTHLWVANNKLDSLPDLSKLTKLVSVKIKNNRLDFEDVAKVISSTGIKPDAGEDIEMSIRRGKHYVRLYNGLLILAVNVRGSGNIYQWYHNKNPLSSETSSTILIRDIEVADTGLYHCEVTNARISDMTLISSPDTLQILPLSLDSFYLATFQNSIGKTIWDLSQPLATWSKIRIENGRVISLNLENIGFKSQFLDGLKYLDALKSLDLSGNKFKISPDLSYFKSLKFLDLSNNELRKLNSNIKRLDSLETFWVFANKLTALPNLSHLPNLRNLKVQTNYLGFEDLRLNLNPLQHNSNNYSPQFIEFPGAVHLKSPASTFNLQADVPNAQAYRWFHNDSIALSETTKNLFISGLELGNAGIYRCDITHNSVPGLVLQTFDTLFITRTVTESDSLALVSLYNYTRGIYWNRAWNLNKPIYEWHGVISSKGRVVELKLKRNNLRGILPQTLLKLDSLKQLDASFNSLYDLQDLGTAKLLKLKVDHNYLDFVALKPNRALLGDSTTYSPQTFNASGKTYSLERGDFVKLFVRVRSDSTNLYQWFYQDKILTGENKPNLGLSNIQKADEGLYHCEIKNSAVPNLTLKSNPDQIFVPRTVTQSDSLALVALYNKTGGAKWRIQWDLKTPVNTWLGLRVDDARGRVTHLILNNNNLKNTIPDSLSHLDALVYLDLSHNQLSSAIPLSILKLENLEVLNLAANQFSYRIPLQLGSLENLKQLNLENNLLSGSIPASITNLRKIEIVDLSNNKLEGSLPTDIGSLSQLKKLLLHKNKLSGTLPTSLGNLSNLTHLNLASNQFRTGLPASLYKLAKLEYLDLNSNYLSGSITAQIGNLHNLKYMDFSSNLLTDSIPFSLGELSNLKVLRLDHNQFKDVPDWSAKLPALTDFQLAYNYLGTADLKPNLPKLKNELARYSPQIIRSGRKYNIDMGATFKVEVEVEGNSNQYQWAVEERFLQNQTKPKLQIDEVSFADENLYYCRVTTSTIPGLLLFSLPDTLTIKNVAPISISLSSDKLYSSLTTGAEIGTLNTQDSNLIDKHIYTLSGADARYFKIVNNQLVAGDYHFDFENKPNYNIRITSTDLDGLAVSQNFKLSYIANSRTNNDDISSINSPDSSDTESPSPDQPDLDDDRPVIDLNTVSPYPNPTHGSLSFKGLPNDCDCGIEIINQLGRVVRLYTKAQAVYNLIDLPKGLYLVRITVGTKTKILKIILN